MDDQAFPDVSKSLQKPSRRPRLLVYIVLFLIILGILIFAGSKFLGSQGGGEPTPTPATPTVAVEPTEEPTPEVTGDLTPTKKQTSPTPKATSTPKYTPDPSKSGLTIQVLNGSGEKGVASQMAETLRSLGYTVSSTGNADTFDYQNVTIQIKSTKSNLLTQLRKDLSSDYTVGSTTTDLSASTSADAVVIVGK